MLGDPRFADGYRLSAGLGRGVFAAGCWFVWLARQGRLARMLNALTPTSLRGSPRLARFVGTVEDCDAALVAGYRASPRRMPTLLVLAFLTCVAGVFEIQIILAAAGHPVAFADAWMIEAAAQPVRAAAFFVPSGLGVVDGSFVLVTGSTPLGFLVAVVRRACDLVWIGLGFVAGPRLGGAARAASRAGTPARLCAPGAAISFYRAPSDPEATVNPTLIHEMSAALERYFDLMYDCDVAHFDQVFAATAQLHGFREGQMSCWPAGQYKEVLAGRKSPKSQGAPRESQVLLLDFTSPTQALAKVRVRIGDMVFVDYLSYHRIDGRWLVTSKAYHREA